MNYEVIIGIEIHLELKTKTKMFSPALVDANEKPNSLVSVIDMAFPGTLPCLNKEAVKLGLVSAFTLNCEVDSLLRFDRKNYFYSDLPKGFQITQQYHPLGKNGYVLIKVDGLEKQIRINRIHLEEDTAKQFHEEDNTLIDFNRSGIPLLEIVSEPDLRSGEQAMAYVEKLRSILYYLGVSDCKMEEGSLRCDVNVSLRPYGQLEFNNKTEIKNLNSINNIKRAVEAEIDRQSAILSDGGVVQQATCRYDESLKTTVVMRKKEGVVDYKYFPEPNIPLIRLDSQFLQEAKDSIGELPDERLKRYLSLGLNEYDSSLLIQNKELGDFFDLAKQDTKDYKILCNWLTGEFTAYISKNQLDIKNSKITPKNMAELVELIGEGVISSKQAKMVFIEMDAGKNPKTIVKEKGLRQVTDVETIMKLVEQVIEENPMSVSDYHEGKDRALGFLVGQVMKLSLKQANPATASELLKKALKLRREK